MNGTCEFCKERKYVQFVDLKTHISTLCMKCKDFLSKTDHRKTKCKLCNSFNEGDTIIRRNPLQVLFVLKFKKTGWTECIDMTHLQKPRKVSILNMSKEYNVLKKGGEKPTVHRDTFRCEGTIQEYIYGHSSVRRLQVIKNDKGRYTFSTDTLDGKEYKQEDVSYKEITSIFAEWERSGISIRLPSKFQWRRG
jgi:hypothetical protein